MSAASIVETTTAIGLLCFTVGALAGQEISNGDVIIAVGAVYMALMMRGREQRGE